MNGIDKGLMAIALYILFSALFSLASSMLSSSDNEDAEVRHEDLKQSAKEVSRNKKEKIVKPGFAAYCNVCERTLETDTYLKNHLEGAKHIKKAKNFKGEVYNLVKAQR